MKINGKFYKSKGFYKPSTDREFIRETYFDDLANLLLNSIRIDGLPFYLQNYVKRQLFEGGAVGYDSAIDEWAAVSPESRNKYGLPFRVRFRLDNGLSWRREVSYKPKTAGAFYIVATPTKATIFQKIDIVASQAADSTIGISQNMNACKTPFFIVVDNAETMLSINALSDDIQEGVPVVKIDSTIAEGLKTVKNETPFIVDKLLEARKQILNDFLNGIGILTANSQKRERVQVGEVNAAIGECVDNIYVIIDTVNKQFEDYNLPYKVVFNESLNEMYDKFLNDEVEEV